MRFIVFKRGNYEFAVNIERVERVSEALGKGDDRLKDVPATRFTVSFLLVDGGRINVEHIKNVVDAGVVLEVASYISSYLPFVKGAIEVEGSLIPVVE